MAEPWKKSFGRYLKILRERAGYSLDDVCSLSQTFPDRINKSYLSRCENGLQGLSFSKLIPLSRIYDVPSEVLVERMELDMELDRVGGPETEGVSFNDLVHRGTEALRRGTRWIAYASFRDAIPKARQETVLPRYQSSYEQALASFMNCATVARSLGRDCFAQHEFEYIRSTDALGPRLRPLLLILLSQGHRKFQEMELAEERAESSIKEAVAAGDVYGLASAQANRAQLALTQGDHRLAISLNQQAFKNFQDAKDVSECPKLLLNLAQSYFDLKRYRAARRAIAAAEKLAQSRKQRRAVALGHILSGEIDEIEGKGSAAGKHWREAAGIARQLKDKTLRFKAEFFLYRQARRTGNSPALRALGRRLTKTSPWIPSDTWELAEFRKLSS